MPCPGVRSAAAEERFVQTTEALREAIRQARPGDRIVLAPGDYDPGRTRIGNGGAPDAPITLTSLAPGQARIHSSVVELFKVSAPYWIFENLDIVGNERTDHAFHIVADAHHTIVRGNRLRNFHAAIKGNPERDKKPNNVIIQGNLIYNDAIRGTSAPVTPIDVNEADDWVVRQNFIADFAKSAGNRISYGAFFKGGGRGNLFERNLVVCEWRHEGGRRVGLSFGGGGFFKCPGPDCQPEQYDGVMRNNIILNCPQAPGVYLNRASGSRVDNNTIVNAYGILGRFPSSGNLARNNIVSGAIATRQDAEIEGADNLETGLSIGEYIPGAAVKLKHRISDYHVKFPNWVDQADVRWVQGRIQILADWLGKSFVGHGTGSLNEWFVAPELGDLNLLDGSEILGRALPLPDVTEDFCGQPRGQGAVDLGAIEYSSGPCDPNDWLAVLFAPYKQGP